jgi:molybdopterin biosynthesis enzyme
MQGVTSCDAVVTTGGVSMGDVDLVKVVLDVLGELRWMQVAIKPAKPFAFGLVDGVPVFGLPGNPVSSLVSFELFARPAIRRLAGHPIDRLDRPCPVAVVPEGLPRKVDGKLHLVRVVARVAPDGGFEVRSAGPQGSHHLTAMAAANGLAVVPDGDGVPPGGTVDVLITGEL